MAGRPLQAEVGEWVAEGLVGPEEAQRIVARYPPGTELAPASRTPTGPGWPTRFLYALAGILIGAAVIAGIVVGLEPPEPGPLLFMAGLLLSAVGVVLAITTDRDLLADALVIAGFVPTAVGGFADEPRILPIIGAVSFFAVLVWRHERAVVQGLAVAAYAVAALAVEFEFGAGDDALLFVLLMTAAVGTIIALDTWVRRDDPVGPILVAIAAWGVGLFAFLWDQTDESVAAEIILGVVFLALILGGLKLGHKGVVTASVLGLGADAVGFGFDVGGWYVGVPTLLALAGAFIWQAERLRGFFAGT